MSKTEASRVLGGFGGVLFALIALFACAAIARNTATAPSSTDPITSAEINQKGFPFPADPPSDADHAGLVNYAWRLFMASNQLAGSTRGEAATTASFADTGSSSAVSGPLVWESFYHRSEAYPYYTSTKPSKPSSSTATKPTYHFETITVSSSESQWNNLDENNQIGQNTIFFPKGSAHPTNPSADSQILFQAKVNANEQDYVWSLTTKPSPFDFPTSGPGTIEVKSAWRLASDIGDTSRYHTAMANYYTGSEEDPEVESAEFALLGLHIIIKTANHPTFMFSTFEQIDSLTDASGNATGLYYIPSYTELRYLPSGTSQTPSATYSGAYTTIKPASAATDVTTTTALPAGGAVPASTKVEQPKTITAAAVDATNNVHGLLPSGNVWKYYALKGVQSLETNTTGSGSSRTGVTTTPDYYLANIVIESSRPGVQLFKGFAPGPNSSLYHNSYSSGWNKWSFDDSAVKGSPDPNAFFAVSNPRTSGNNLEAFAIDGNNKLWHNYYDVSWHTWNDSDTAVSGAPATSSFFGVANPNNNNLEVYVIDTSGTLWHNYYDGQWNSWSSSDTAVAGSPKASSFFGVANVANGNLEVYAIDTSGTLWHNYYNGQWNTWSSTDTAVTGSPKSSDFFAVVNTTASNHLEVYAIAEDGTLWHNWFDTAWHSWSSSDSAVAGSPKSTDFFAVVNTLANDQLEAYAIAEDGTLWHTYYDTTWHAWSDTGNALAGAPRVKAIAGAVNTIGSNHLEMYAIDEDSKLWHTNYDTGWHAWNDTDGAVAGSPPVQSIFPVVNEAAGGVLETYAIDPNGRLEPQLAEANVTAPDGTNVTIGGCKGCHGVAQQFGLDFSFLTFGFGGTGFKPDPLIEGQSVAAMQAMTANSPRRVK